MIISISNIKTIFKIANTSQKVNCPGVLNLLSIHKSKKVFEFVQKQKFYFYHIIYD